MNIENGSIDFTIENIALYSGTYDGNSTAIVNNTSLTKYGIYALNSGECELKNVLIRGCNSGYYFLAPWKVNFIRCKVLYSNDGFSFGYRPQASGTTTFLENCYSITCNRGYYATGMNTITLKLCSADYSQQYAYHLDNTKNSSIENCSAEQTTHIVIRLIYCSGIKVSGLQATGVIAASPFAYKESPIYLSQGDAIFENVNIANLTNSDGSAYANTLDLYNMSVQSGNGYSFNYKFVNCTFPNNAKATYINGDTGASSSLEFENSNGTRNIYPNLSNAMYRLPVPNDFKKFATSVPTTGTWNQGDYVVNQAPTQQGSAGSMYVIKGWIRATTGSGNVLNTDWFQDRALTGN